MSAIANNQDDLITHRTTDEHDKAFQVIRERIQASDSLTFSRESTLKLFEELAEFDLGRFLLGNRGLNGYWTAYLILHGPKIKPKHPLEKWLIEKAPGVVATRERFGIFQKLVRERLRPGMTVASIPCGLMDDLITLDYRNTPDVKLVGIDLDQKSLDLAQENARKHGLQNNSKFIKKSAWRLDRGGEFDIIVSNGLNIYVADDEKIISLYHSLGRVLKPGGILITSFMTPPPQLSPESTWRDLDPENLKKQKALFSDIIQASWQSFRTEAQTRKQLEAAGLKIVNVIYDKCGLFPTIVAEKVNPVPNRG